MAKNRVHVTPHAGGGWQVKVGGNNRASAVRNTQKEAIEIGRDKAREMHTDLSIHNQQGRIRDVDSYGNDPCPPKDTKH